MGVVVTVADNAVRGEHILWCEVMKETRDPGGGTEFRIVAVAAA